ncbi:MAG: 30S ribosome-binding factor RbfA [Gemmatimonadales bacterium]
MRGSPSRRRPDQVAELVRQVVADALLREVRDPRVQGASVTRVEVTPDLSRARILVLARGDDAEREATLAGLESAAGFLRGRVAKALSARTTPELDFVLDRGLEHAARIDELLAEIRREGES